MIARRFILFGAGGAALALAGCQTETPHDGTRPILEVMSSVPDISSFRAAIRRAGLDEALAGAGPFTVFAPSNTAWSAAPAALRDGNPAALRSLIALGRMRTPDLFARRQQPIRMLSGTEVRVVGGSADAPRLQVAREGQPTGGSASILRGNMLGANGVLHILDAIIIPTAA